MMSHPAMSLGDRLCASREGGAGGGGWVHPKGANSMAVSGLRDRKVLVGTGRAISAWPCLGSAIERSWSALGGPFPPFLA